MQGDDLTAFAGVMLDVRQGRAAHVPADMLRGEQPWDLLLILFIADGRGNRITGREAILRDGGAIEAGRRWLLYLARIGYVAGDGDGDLDDVLTMTPQGVHAMETWLRHALDRNRAFAAKHA